MTRSKRSFHEVDRREMLDLARDVRQRAIRLLAGLPIKSDAYATVSAVLDAANAMLTLLEGDDWRGRNSIGSSG